MGNGFVIFVINSNNLPCYMKFYDNGSSDEKSSVNDATVYPIYEAAEAVKNKLQAKGAYLYVAICNSDGTPCMPDKASNTRTVSDTRYIRKSSSNDEFF